MCAVAGSALRQRATSKPFVTAEPFQASVAQRRFHVLVVDDGSEEHTRRTLAYLAEQHPQVTLLRLAKNSGKGAAVMAGDGLGRDFRITRKQPESAEITRALPT